MHRYPRFARSRLLEAFCGRMFDFRGSLNSYGDSGTPDGVDARAIHDDWLAIGEDLQVALSAGDRIARGRGTSYRRP